MRATRSMAKANDSQGSRRDECSDDGGLSPLINTEADENKGRLAFQSGYRPIDCPFPSGKSIGEGYSVRRKSWMAGFYAEKYLKRWGA